MEFNNSRVYTKVLLMSNKQISSFDVYEVPSRGPHTKLEMLFETIDGWFYKYVSFEEGEPFTFHNKRRPDMDISEDDVTPQSIKEFVERQQDLNLINPKTIYYAEYPKRSVER